MLTTSAYNILATMFKDFFLRSVVTIPVKLLQVLGGKPYDERDANAYLHKILLLWNVTYSSFYESASTKIPLLHKTAIGLLPISFFTHASFEHFKSRGQ